MKISIEITPDLLDQIPLSEIINHFGKDKIAEALGLSDANARINDLEASYNSALERSNNFYRMWSARRDEIFNLKRKLALAQTV